MNSRVWLRCIFLLAAVAAAAGMDLNEMKKNALKKQKRVRQEEEEKAKEIAKDQNYGKRPYDNIQKFLGSTLYAAQLSRPAEVQLAALKEYKEKMGLSKEDMELAMQNGSLPKILGENMARVKADMDMPVPTEEVCPYVQPDNVLCQEDNPFRTFDGSCNNLKMVLSGKSMRPLSRFLPPDYADGIDLPRAASGGGTLPSAREVSISVYEDVENPSGVATMMHMTFGQLLDHDMDRTAITKLMLENGTLVDVKCGDSGCETIGTENRACFPIEVPLDDPNFPGPCLQFVRTAPVLADICAVGPRQQLNQITSYIDASMVYGSDITMAHSLRELTDPTRGRMLTSEHPFDPDSKPLLPIHDEAMCRNLTEDILCFRSGDARTNEHVGLSSLHTLFLREHNRIEEQLHIINPHWLGERLYQESRKIVGAIMQHITYKEYLPLVLGPDLMDSFDLTLKDAGFFKGYDDKVHADVSNVFATAAFRSGHSQVANFIRFISQNFVDDQDLPFANVFFRPWANYQTTMPGGHGIDSVVLGHTTQPSERAERFFASSVTVHMFTDNPPDGLGTDLPALNTQRGRDHGLPAYNKWREWCGLSTADNFDDMTDMPCDVRVKFAELYDDVEDVDLYPAGMSENHLPGAMVGPTFGCILGRQFHNTKVGDRFWYENKDKKVGFTKDQLAEIRKMTFARVICDNLNFVETIQKYVLIQPLSEATQSNADHMYDLMWLYADGPNERGPCDDLPSMDFTPWMER